MTDMATRPEKVTGGCLCGQIRYQLTFPDDASWPADTASCQCTLCRKFSGSLICYDMLLKPNQLSDITKAPTYKEYKSSENGYRSFCSNCGSGLTWRLDVVPDMLVLFIGSIDEEYLLGKKIKGTEETTETGLKFKWDGGLCKELTRMNFGHLFWNNRIPGVTDQETLNGPKFPQSFPQE